MGRMSLREFLLPGLLLSETHFAFRKEKGVVCDAVDRVAGEGYFEAVAIPEVESGEDREKIRQIVESHGITLTQWASLVIGDEGLDLCSMDARLRTRSLSRVAELAGLAAETGVHNFGILCGPDPGEDLRAAATEMLFESLGGLCEAISAYPGMRLMIEPLDRDVHKKGLIGPTPEAVALVERLQKTCPLAGLSLDTSHAVLLGEDPLETLELLGPYLLEIHFSNPVLDRSDPSYGDMHIPPGPPGVLDIPDFARVLVRGAESGILAENVPVVSAEVRAPPGADPWDTVELCKDIMERTLELAESGENGSVCTSE